MVMNAGLAILHEEGLRTGSEITFKRVFDRVEADMGVRLTNASVIRRIWTDQSDFQSDLLARVVADTNETGQLIAARDLMVPLIEASDRTTPEDRWRSASEIARRAGATAIDTRVGTRNWELWVSVWAVSVTNPASRSDARVQQALLDGLELTGAAWNDLLTMVMGSLGLRMKAPFTLRQYTESLGAVAAGYSLRHASRGQPQFVKRPTGPDGELQDWTLMGIALEALAMEFLEIDPDWSPRA